MEKPGVPPPALLIGAALTQLALGRRKRPRRRLLRRVLGGGAALAGGALFVGGVGQLFLRGTTVDPRAPEESSELVTDGLYRVSRNPVYLGDVLLLLGLAIGQGKLVSFLPVAAFAALIDRRQIPAEEAALRARFGSEFERYAEGTPRWI
ncbi:methyltransferase family protein [Naumannella huperziae]